MDAITIQNVELPVVEIEGQRVVTLSMVDKVHQRPEGTASRNFREHRPRLIETEDYFQMSSDEIRRNNPSAIPAALRRNDVILLTATGYVRLSDLRPIIPLSDSTIWRRVRLGTFPAPVKLSERITAWRAEDVRRWLDQQGKEAA